MNRDAVAVKAEMLIRKPVAEVFEAFINPEITSEFWFTRSSGRLTPGAAVRWDWDMYGVGTDVQVKAVEANRRILIEWDEPPTTVEWLFTSRGDNETFVTITNAGFSGDDDAVLAAAIDSMGGFSLVLAGAKAWLEHGIRLNLTADHAPDANVAG